MEPSTKLVDYSRFASNGEDVEVGPDIDRPLSPTERLLAWSESYRTEPDTED
jgi:hypothetical protein